MLHEAQEQFVKTRTGLRWVSIRCSGAEFRDYERLLASNEKLCYMELVALHSPVQTE
jgi:hypothetical protein